MNAARLPPEGGVCTGALPESLLRIRQPHMRLAIWERRVPRRMTDWLKTGFFPAGGDLRCEIKPGQHPAVVLDASLMQTGAIAAPIEHRALLWRRDVLDLISLAQRIAPQAVLMRLRLQRLEGCGCTLFHVDGVPLRLICTYFGAGTEWLPESAVDRACLGTGGNRSVRDWNAVRSLAPGEVAVMKGEAYPGNTGRGLVHRSPHASPAAPRILMALDFG